MCMDLNTDSKMREWIDNASYTQLLARWRFAPAGSPWFQGEIGKYYESTMAKKRREVGESGHVQASKEIGWQFVVTLVQIAVIVLKEGPKLALRRQRMKELGLQATKQGKKTIQISPETVVLFKATSSLMDGEGLTYDEIMYKVLEHWNQCTEVEIDRYQHSIS